MQRLKADLSNLSELFSEALPQAKVAAAQTAFLKKLSLEMHRFYGGKMQTLPKAGIYGFNWFNLWYTPGVSMVSTTIRDAPESSYALSNRGNLVAVVSDSTRVLGDGDCGVYGGLGVMEGKAMLMKYLGGMDAMALCVNNRDKNGRPNAEKLIDFVKMLEPSVAAVNLEDISQPNCYRVLDALRETCAIPVWHDDAQGTACVTLAGVINALRLTGRELSSSRVVLFGAGASNTTIASFLMQAGLPPENLTLNDSRGALHRNRTDLRDNPEKFKQWGLAQITNPQEFNTLDEALKGADILIALSQPGPGVIKPDSIKLMAEKAIVFACANPVPEIYPFEAHEAGAYIVATGRGDFPNQVNNSLGFPGILKGALLVQATKITDNMAISAAHSLADFAMSRGIGPDNILARMDETEVFAHEAADVAMQAIKDGVALKNLSREEAYEMAWADIMSARKALHTLMDSGLIKEPPQELINKVFEDCLKEFTKA